MPARPTPAEQAAELLHDVHHLTDRIDELAVTAFDTEDVATLTRLQRALARIVARETESGT
jgi:hypothetical protein